MSISTGSGLGVGAGAGGAACFVGFLGSAAGFTTRWLFGRGRRRRGRGDAVPLLRSGAFVASSGGGGPFFAASADSASISPGSAATGSAGTGSACSTSTLGAPLTGACAAGARKSCQTRKPAYKKTTIARTITNHFNTPESAVTVRTTTGVPSLRTPETLPCTYDPVPAFRL